MEHLLYLAHRIPFPPNKGDKIRSFNLLRFLSQRYVVHLGCFVDRVEDEAHVEALGRWCAEACVVRLYPRRARLRSLMALARGEALTLAYYRSRRLQDWVDATLVSRGISRAVTFSSPMAQYLREGHGVRTVVDLVDVDSAKWTEYATRSAWPLSALYRREGARLLNFERAAVERAAAGVLVTRSEAAIFQRLAPAVSRKMHVIENGVDSQFFSPQEGVVAPYATGERAVVFTGAMDYWPNIDAVRWFARDVLPAVLAVAPDVRFYVVGMNPAPAVQKLAENPRVIVTGMVEDVRPYLQHAAAVVAPLRIARGVQNKVLEAMSMARPVVVSAVAAAGISGTAGVDFESAASAEEFAAKTLAVLDPQRGGPMGRRAQGLIWRLYRWDASLARFLDLLDGTAGASRDPCERPETQDAALVAHG